uniref:transposase n=1 Tax=Enterocloster clostridioformis TaxID=1531 RepID=UPI003FA4AEB5
MRNTIDLVDYLNNNLLIAYYCGFEISLLLPSYWTFDRFLKNFDHSILSDRLLPSLPSLANPDSLTAS